MVAYETSIQRVIAICQASNSLTLRGKPRSTAENRDTQNSLKLCETVVVRVMKHRIKYFARAVSRLTARGQIDIHLTSATMGERWEKNATPPIFIKVEEALAGQLTKYGVKYFSGAGSRMDSRGQIDIQITWETMSEMSVKLHHFRIHSNLVI